VRFERDVFGPGDGSGGYEVDTQVGGTQTFTLQPTLFDDSPPYDGLFVANGDGLAFVVDSTDGPHVTVRSFGGPGYVIAYDLTGKPLACAELASGNAFSIAAETTHEMIANDSGGVVLAPGHQTLGIAYREATGGRIIDSGATLSADGATAIDSQRIDFADATVGLHHVTATLSTGDMLELDAEVVDHVDTIVPHPFTLFGPTAVSVCFDPLNAGRFVEGVTWTVTANGVAGTPSPLGASCFDFALDPAITSFTLVASALHASITVEVPIDSARARGVQERGGE
jgi:hypothetical protein